MKPIPPGQIPFPPLLVALSARSASFDLAEHAQNPSRTLTDTHRLAAYRLPDGTVRPAYDYYDPSYPEGATPGLATVRSIKRFYPNETAGYDLAAFNFRPASEFLRDFPIDDMKRQANPWDGLTIAHYEIDALQPGGRPQSGFILALEEDQMSAWLSSAPKGARILRHNITRCGTMDEDQGPQEIFMALGSGGGNLFVAASKEDLADALRARFSFMNLPEGAQAAIDQARAAAISNGWTVAHQEISTTDFAMHPGGCTCPNCVVGAANRKAAMDWEGCPTSALLRAPEVISMALVETNHGDVIVHAETEKDLALHVARAALAKHGVSEEIFGPEHPVVDMGFREDAGHVLDRLWESDADFYIWECRGEAHLAYGCQPSHFAVIRDGSGEGIEPELIGFAASSRAGLERVLIDGLSDRLGLVGPVDFYDLQDAIDAHADYVMSLHTSDELAELIHAKTQNPSEILEP